MRRVHFKQLESHRKPLFQLYRRLIKYTYHVPLSFNYQVYLRTEVSRRFHDGKKIMAPSIAREKLITANEWELNMRNSILFDLEMFDKMELSQSLDTNTNTHLAWIQNQIDDYMRESLEKYQKKSDQSLVWNPPKQGVELKNFICMSRTQFQRQKMIKEYQKNGLISARKDLLDPTYIDYVLLPEWMEKKERERTAKRKRIETEKPQETHMVYVPTPLGRIYFLRQPWGQSHDLTRFIHASVHTKVPEKVAELEELEKLAVYEAQWEALVNPDNSQSVAELKEQWTQPIKSALLDLRVKKTVFERKTSQYVATNVSRKRLKDIELQGKHERNVLKWANIEKEKKRRPYLHFIHSGVRRMV